jgi:hypothetical protein
MRRKIAAPCGVLKHADGRADQESCGNIAKQRRATEGFASTFVCSTPLSSRRSEAHCLGFLFFVEKRGWEPERVPIIQKKHLCVPVKTAENRVPEKNGLARDVEYPHDILLQTTIELGFNDAATQ